MNGRAPGCGWLVAGVLTLLACASARADLRLVERWPQGGNACPDSPLRLTFDQPPMLGSAGKIEVCRASDGVPVETISRAVAPGAEWFEDVGGFMMRGEPWRIEGNTAVVRLHARALAYGQAYIVRVGPEVFKDFAGITDPWKFEVKAAPPRGADRWTVAADGSGDFCTVQGAVNQVEPHRERPTVIFIRKGVYHELVRIGRAKRFVHLLGEDRRETVITYANNDRLHPGWLPRSVLGVEADDFTLENMTVRNTTPRGGSQAEALYVDGERCALRHADFASLQDTLNLSGRVYANDCNIEGDVDYVWGYGTAFFERCELHTLHDGYIVQARNPPGGSGYVFLDCRFTATPEVKKCWLARIETARFPGSHVAFIRCRMNDRVPPEGWQLTGAPDGALRFEESASMTLDGQLLDVHKRLPGSRQLAADAAETLSSTARVLGGLDGWNPVADPGAEK